MMTRSLFALALFSSALAAADPGEPPPRPVVAECAAPLNGTDLSKNLAAGPQLVGRYKIKNGTTIRAGKLQISANGDFIPDRVGSTTGEVVARFNAEIMDKAERLPVLSDNNDTGFAPGSARVGPYRVTLKVATQKPLVYEATVERLGCEYRQTRKPFTDGEVDTFWMSTNGITEIRFSDGDWYDNDPSFFITFSASLDPDVQQDDKKHPHGYMSMESGTGSMAYQDGGHFSGDKFVEGATTVRDDHKIEIVKIIFGKDTVWKEGRITTPGAEPTAHVLVRVTKLKPKK
ncbi:MAG TPA: hypothetical protein VGM90_29880 [Kofleriaceae bacterium]|jgi:hypothetical protein